jgi:hypothetical protein
MFKCITNSITDTSVDKVVKQNNNLKSFLFALKKELTKKEREISYKENKIFIRNLSWEIACDRYISERYLVYYLQTIKPDDLITKKFDPEKRITIYTSRITILHLDAQNKFIEWYESINHLIMKLQEELDDTIKRNKEEKRNFSTTCYFLTRTKSPF